MKSDSHEQWKKYFDSAECSIYEIIHNAIMVAALDDPKKFRHQRDKITEKLYSVVQVCGSCCSYVVDHHYSNVENTKSEDEKSECANTKPHFDEDAEVGIKKFEEHELNGDRQTVGVDQTSNYTMQETEELGDKIEVEHENIRHILEIKERLDNNDNESETEIVHLLRMLSLTVLSVEELKVTNIGTTVSDLQHHWSRKVNQAARITNDKFKSMIKDWTSDNAALSERSKEPVPPTFLDENVLLNPPMDEGVPMYSIPPGEFLTFFEDLDDDGNPIISNETEKVQESQKKCPTENKTKMKLLSTSEGSASISRNSIRKEKQQLTDKLINPKNSRPSHNRSEIGMIQVGQRNPPAENKRKVELLLREDLEPFPTIKRQKPARKESKETLTKQTNSRPSDTEHSSQRLGKQRVRIDVDNDIKTKEKNDKQKPHQRSNAGLISQSPPGNFANLDEKLEISKRKLHQGYLAHEKSRRITKYIADIGDIPRDESRSSRWRYNNKRL